MATKFNRAKFAQSAFMQALMAPLPADEEQASTSDFLATLAGATADEMCPKYLVRARIFAARAAYHRYEAIWIQAMADKYAIGFAEGAANNPTMIAAQQRSYQEWQAAIDTMLRTPSVRLEDHRLKCIETRRRSKPREEWTTLLASDRAQIRETRRG